MYFTLPDDVIFILRKYEDHGFKAYIVGGCVRDLLLNKVPIDWDICTDALPEQSREVFTDVPPPTPPHECGGSVSPHIYGSHQDSPHIYGSHQDSPHIYGGGRGGTYGTITLSLNHAQYEITTFRKEAVYSDHRHPDSIEFVKNLHDDLQRRDFTINAMAYNPQDHLIDLFGGQHDIRQKIIRCVGNPDTRFREDALRILRALRFATTLDFDLEEKTEKALFDNRKLLLNISGERISAELNKILMGDNIHIFLMKYFEIFCVSIPELKLLQNNEQQNPYHIYDILTHTAFCLQHAKKDIMIRLTMLFHDIGKPECKTTENGIHHFYGHSKKSVNIAKSILKRLKYDQQTIETVTTLILYHDTTLTDSKKSIKRWLNKIGEERFRQLLEVKYADTMAKSEKAKHEKLPLLKRISELLEEIISSKQCFSIKDLAIDGNDLINIGIPEGKEIGQILKHLLELVIDEEIENQKEELLKVLRDAQ